MAEQRRVEVSAPTLIEAAQGYRAQRLADALRKAIAEHGDNNTFTCGELASIYGGPPAASQGRMPGALRFDINGVPHEARRHRSGTPIRTGWAVGPV